MIQLLPTLDAATAGEATNMIATTTAFLLAMTLNSTDAIKDYIIARAQDYYYPVYKALAIAECESGFLSHVKNASSTATGVYMFIDSTWKLTMKEMGLPQDSNKRNAILNIEAALYRLDKYGNKDWNASKKCWQPKYLDYLNSYDTT